MSGRSAEHIADNITISAIVPAAGCGTRTGLASNKILASLHGRPLLYWTIRALLQPAALPSPCRLSEIVIASRREEWDEIAGALAGLPLIIRRPADGMPQTGSLPPTAITQAASTASRTPCRLVEGGQDRQSSVGNAARVAQGSLLLVHDAARPLLSSALIHRVCRAALEGGAAIAALPCSDTLKRAVAVPQNRDENLARTGNAVPPAIYETIERSGIWLAQTPQVFERSLLLAAQQYASQTGFTSTDCASLLEHQPGAPQVALVEGDPLNFKVTYAADIERAALLLPLVEGFGDSFDDTLEK